MKRSYIHRAYNLVTNLPMRRKSCTRQTGSTPHTAFIATGTLYNDSCAAHVACVNNTWVKTSRFALPATASCVQNTLNCMALPSCHARLHGIACHPNGRHVIIALSPQHGTPSVANV
eukprot:5546135-Karenia_brevis.AAC.1